MARPVPPVEAFDDAEVLPLRKHLAHRVHVRHVPPLELPVAPDLFRLERDVIVQFGRLVLLRAAVLVAVLVAVVVVVAVVVACCLCRSECTRTDPSSVRVHTYWPYVPPKTDCHLELSCVVRKFRQIVVLSHSCFERVGVTRAF